MDKTIKVNLGGILFQLEEDAYKILRDYLQAIDLRLKNMPGGNETLEDIESRIAEIFQLQKNLAGVITKENVTAMIAMIGQPEDFDNSSDIGSEGFNNTQATRRLQRNPTDSIIGGVCGGIGAYFNLDPVLIRIAFIIFTFFFGIGVLVYIALWIALPGARVPDQKRREPGMSGYPGQSGKKYPKEGEYRYYYSSPETQYRGSSPAGNAVNEIFRALGKAFFVILRLMLIILGVALVLAGFLAILAFVMVFFFKFPAFVSGDNIGVNAFYLKDLINLIVDPSVTPWILALAFLVVALPMLALIYWGVKSIFWFRARDGIFSLAGFLIWIASIAVLAMILLNEGVSFSRTGKSVRNLTLQAPDTLNVLSGRKISELSSVNRLSLPGEDLNIYFDDEYKKLKISANFDIELSEDNNAGLEVMRRSTGRTRSEAIDKANELVYNFTFSDDSVILDEYFSVPQDKKWSFDNITIRLSIPDGTVIHFDDPSGALWHQYTGYERDEDYDPDLNRKNGNYWKMTDGNLTKIEVKAKLQRH
jgi:phage shock protein PspC (stress-responsive transcriptional regulator)